MMDMRQSEFLKSFKNIDQIFMQTEVKVPPIIYLANKSENFYEGDILGEFYQMFPHSNELDLLDGKPIEPIFISAEHGDGLPDLYREIEKRIPSNYYIQ